MVKRFLKTFLAAMILVVALHSIVCAENSEQVEILNDTGHIIESLYIAPEGNLDWGRDFAASAPFEVFQWKIIKYNPTIRYFKIKVTLDNGREFTWAGNKRVNFAGAQRLILYSGKRDSLKYAIYRSQDNKVKIKKSAHPD